MPKKLINKRRKIGFLNRQPYVNDLPEHYLKSYEEPKKWLVYVNDDHLILDKNDIEIHNEDLKLTFTNATTRELWKILNYLKADLKEGDIIKIINNKSKRGEKYYFQFDGRDYNRFYENPLPKSYGKNVRINCNCKIKNPIKYKLENALKMARKYPKTFHIPSLNIRYNLKPGQFAKIIFIDEKDKNKRERMWVKVVQNNKGNYIGTLDNDPKLIRGLKWKDGIAFNAKNIIDYMF